MRLLDLFCGAGGAAMGYHRAGFNEIVGVDIHPQPSYPFHFIQGDATAPPVNLDGFDLIHASPPCQRFSTATANPDAHPDLIEPIRELLSGRAHVIENVVTAPLRPDLKLCGSMFGLQVQRHRIFELSWFIWNPPQCSHQWAEGRPWTVVGNPGGPKPWHKRRQGSTTHSFKYRDLQHGRDLMDMQWCQKAREITEAIPPAFTEWIGREWLHEQQGS